MKNFKQKNEERKRILGLFLNNSPEGTIKFSNESLEHFLVKAQVFFYLKTNGYSVWSEPVLRKFQKRPDLLCLHNNGTSAYIVEIIKSESKSSVVEKSNAYPLPIITFNCKKFKYEEFEI